MLDEVAAGDMGLELLGGQEVVVDAVALAGPRAAGGRRDRQLEAGTRSSSPRISVPFPTPDGPVITKTLLTVASRLAATP